jgi:hypothetical protein
MNILRKFEEMKQLHCQKHTEVIKNARCATRIHNKVSEMFSDRKILFKTVESSCFK